MVTTHSVPGFQVLGPVAPGGIITAIKKKILLDWPRKRKNISLPAIYTTYIQENQDSIETMSNVIQL